MHRTFSVPRLIGWASFFALLLAMIAPGVASAQQPLQPVTFAQAPPEIQQQVQTITLTVGTTQVYSSKENLKKVENPNAKVLNIRSIDKVLNQVILEAVSPGRTRVTFTDVKDRVDILDVIVITDRVKELREVIARTLPTAAVNVTSTDSGGSVIITGTVLNTNDLTILQQLASGPGIINNVKIGGVQQVQLEVIVALVNRTEARNMTFSWNVNGNNWFLSSLLGGPFGMVSTIAPTPAGATAALTAAQGGANVPFGILNNNGSFMGFLQALRTEGLTKIMAEPRVTTLSGRPAYIVSGGETPILTSGGTGAPSVSYKQFGTVVHVLPIVLGNGKIHLEVRPEISEPDPSLGITIAGITPTAVPGFRTRSVQATVQIDDGQTLAIGGLVQNVTNGTINRVPFLGDLPFVGVAFTSKTFTENEQELIILVTPRLVDPVDCTKIPKYLPGRETRPPDDFELFLEGIMEAPRGPRSVVFHPSHYKPAYHGASNAGEVPCGYNGRHQGGCANGSCGTQGTLSSLRTPAFQNATVETQAPRFPEIQNAPTPTIQVMSETEMPPMRMAPGLGPVAPTTNTVPATNLAPASRMVPATPATPMSPSIPSLPAREFETRPALPPVSPGVFGPR